MNVETVSLQSLRRRALRLGWSARFTRGYNRIAGNDCFVIVNPRNHVVGFADDEDELRDWLTAKIEAADEAW
jgi:hypothetical protein